MSGRLSPPPSLCVEADGKNQAGHLGVWLECSDWLRERGLSCGKLVSSKWRGGWCLVITLGSLDQADRAPTLTGLLLSKMLLRIKEKRRESICLPGCGVVAGDTRLGKSACRIALATALRGSRDFIDHDALLGRTESIFPLMLSRH